MKMTKLEFKKLLNNKILLISVIAITFIPILYSSIFDKSVWDPYGNAKHLPVAVVNEDHSTTLLGQKMDVGSQVVDTLKKNHDLDWHFVSKKDAEKGMKDLKYYMVVTITKDFSKNAASIIKHEPKKMEIIYTTNESLNYIANEISQVAATSLEDQVKDQVVTAYTTAVAEAAGKLVSGLKQASSGTNQLADGTKQLQSGLTEYTGGVGQADAGSKQLAQGIGQLSGNIGPMTSGITQLDDGSKELSTALNKVNGMLNPMKNNVGAIDVALNELSVGTKTLENGLVEFENHLDPQVSKNIENDLKNVEIALSQLVTNKEALNNVAKDANEVSHQATMVSKNLTNAGQNITRIESDMNAYVTDILAGSDIPNDQKETIARKIQEKMNQVLDQQVATAQNDINKNLQMMKESLGTLSTASENLSKTSAGVSNVATSIEASEGTIHSSVATIQQGVEELNTMLGVVPKSVSVAGINNGLNAVSRDLHQASEMLPVALGGVNQLAVGSNQLTGGLDQLKNGMPALSSGVTQLNDGSKQLESGLNELDNNSPQLMTGIKALEKGAGELASAVDEGVDKSSTVKLTKKNINQFANPTKLTSKEYSKVQNYGVALAPYIMSLALFVGSMLFNFVYPIRRVSLADQSSDSWWLSKITLGFTVSSCMAFIQATVMLLIGLPVDKIGYFYLTAFVTAWCYMAVVMFFAMTFDNPGRFIAMILLVLQLGGAGGTFPVEIQSTFFKVIHPYLPMSYSVYAFRESISGGIGAELYNLSINILLFLFVLFIVLLRYSMSVLQNKHLDGVSKLDDNQKLQALLQE